MEWLVPSGGEHESDTRVQRAREAWTMNNNMDRVEG